MEAFAGGVVVGGGSGTLTLVNVDGDGAAMGGCTHKTQVRRISHATQRHTSYTIHHSPHTTHHTSHITYQTSHITLLQKLPIVDLKRTNAAATRNAGGYLVSGHARMACVKVNESAL